MRDRTGGADVPALAGYVLLACIFFWPTLFTNVILTGYDTFTIFYPHRVAAARALLSGRLPLWNPDHFLGAPLLANPQVAVLYPLNWPFLTMPVGQSLAWTMAVHFVLAAAFMYLFARQAMTLTRPAAWMAGMAFSFGGFMAQQTGHLNQVSVAAWLPLILLLGGKAWRWGRGRHIVACGVAIALQFLAGHSQESYMILVTLAAYIAFLTATDFGLRRVLVSWPRLASVVVAVMLGASLSAVQLLPTLELSRLSIRSGGLSFRQASSFSLTPQDLTLSLLPNYHASPPNEMAGYIGVAALALALVGACWFSRRSLARFLAILAGLALVMALGRYTPVYWAAYYLLPGVSFFRVPARWLLVYSFAAAALAGMGLDVLLQASGRIGRRRVLALLAIVLIVAGVVLSLGASLLHLPSRATMVTWGAVAVGLIVAIALVLPDRRPMLFTGVILLVTGSELYAAGSHLEYNRYSAPESLTSLRPAIACLQTQVGGSRVLSVSDATWDPGDLNEIRAGMAGVTPGRVADYVAAIKNKELLTPNLSGYFGLQSADGYDGGVLPLERYVDIEGLFLPADQLSPDGRLRDHLTMIPDARLLALLDVGYVIGDKNHDVWLDDVYYDLAFASRVTHTLTLTVERPFIATAVGLVSRLEGSSDVVSGTVIARLMISDAAGHIMTVPVAAGVHTAAAGQGALPAVPTPADGSYYYSILALPTAIKAQHVTIQYTGGSGALAVRALSLIDQRTAVGLALTVTPDFNLVCSGDVKIYHNNLPTATRLHIVHQARNISDAANAIAVMRRPDFDPAQEVILDEPVPPVLSAADRPEEARIEEYRPERVTVSASLSSPGVLVLGDAYYPGWQARVDGTSVPIMRANYFFRGIALTAGQHRIEFVYQPQSLLRGAIVSLLTVVGIILGIGASRDRRW